MVDLRVDYDELSASREALAFVHQRFSDVTSHVEEDLDCWGHERIVRAMDGFVTNWSAHRTKMLDKVLKLHDLTDECLSTFGQGDQQLADALRVTY